MASLNLAGTITRVCRDLQQRFAAIVHTHAAADITSGTLDAARLPVATTSAVGGVKVDGTTVTISNGVISAAGGGGGGVTLTTATATLTASGWSAYYGAFVQTVSVLGVTATNTVFVSPVSVAVHEWSNNTVSCSAQAAGSLTFSSSTKPTGDIVVNIAIFS